jgi:hypothetical protein
MSTTLTIELLVTTWPLAYGEACGGARLDRIRLLTAKESGAIVLVALGIAAGKGESQRGRCVGPVRPGRR